MVKDNRGKNNPMYGKRHSEETKRKISETRKVRFIDGRIHIWNKGEIGLPQLRHSEKWKINHSKSLTGRKRPDLSKKMIGNGNNFFGKNHTLLTKNKIGMTNRSLWKDASSKYNRLEHRKNISENSRRAWRDPNSKFNSIEHKMLRSKIFRGDRNPSKRKDVKEKISNTRKRLYREGKIEVHGGVELYRNGQHPRGMLGKKHSLDAKKRFSEINKKKWLNEEYAKNIFNKLNMKPNKKENLLNGLLQKNYPDEWKYVGDGYTWIAGKNPDFMNINGKKLLIEFFGDYWHKTEDEDVRRNHFAKYGYKTLIIWEHELKEPTKVINKINSFIK